MEAFIESERKTNHSKKGDGMMRLRGLAITLGLCLFAVAIIALLSLSPATQKAEAESGFWSSAGCSGCHRAPVTSTCNGCHGHGTHSSSAKSSINVAGATGTGTTATTFVAKTTFAPGEQMSVRISGGYRTGWVRTILYDQNMNELARSTGTASSGMGGGPALPVFLSVPAPTTAGTYTWTAAWYGNQFDNTEAGSGDTVFGSRWTPDPNNPEHGEERVSTNSFTVSGAPPPPPANRAPVLNQIPNQTVNEGQALTFAATATDPD
ncbi:MAG TPA: hypothetical protein VLM91_07310, partial [Candidatus Methylomirabilis sp.]|nr:hypothetical protein [Candidatus Methylomirabilis sp.]